LFTFEFFYYFVNDTLPSGQSFVGFRYSGGTDSFWQAVTNDGTSQTTVATTVAIDTNPHTFEIVWTGSSYIFIIDRVVVATISTTIPAANLTGAVMFWTGDNKNTNTAVSGTFYHMIETLM
jgi:hypothetical protein